MEIDSCIGFTSNAGTYAIHDADGQSTILLTNTNCLQCVSRFTALRDCKDDVVLGYEWFPVTEFTCVLLLNRNLCQLFNCNFCNHARMPRSSTRTDQNALGFCDPLQKTPLPIITELFQSTQFDGHDSLILLVNPPTHRIAECIWLVHDLLQHEMFIPTFFDFLQGH